MVRRAKEAQRACAARRNVSVALYLHRCVDHATAATGAFTRRRVAGHSLHSALLRLMARGASGGGDGAGGMGGMGDGFDGGEGIGGAVSCLTLVERCSGFECGECAADA